LKLHTDQAQRLRTQELEEKVVKLEHELDLAVMESRVQHGYIANMKVYEGIVNGYVLRLKERLEQLDPGSRLLEYRIPTMPEKKGIDLSKMAKETDTGLSLLSEIIEGMFCNDIGNCRYAGGGSDGH
jgi:hypothetical protein